MKIGQSVCFDLRFPTLYTDYVKKGANILTISSAFTIPTGKAHWHTLVRARAIENQLFVCGVNRVGSDPNSTFFGRSLIYDPGGNILIEGTEKEEILTCKLDPSVLLEIRSALPSLQHRQPKYY